MSFISHDEKDVLSSILSPSHNQSRGSLSHRTFSDNDICKDIEKKDSPKNHIERIEYHLNDKLLNLEEDRFENKTYCEILK